MRKEDNHKSPAGEEPRFDQCLSPSTPTPQKSPQEIDDSIQKKLRGNPSLPIVAIGASAGGLKALTELFQSMPADTGMAFIVVQHLSANRESMMADILSRSAKMEVIEITDGVVLEPNRIYVMSQKGCISIQSGILTMHTDLDDECMRMPINYFYHSLASNLSHKSIAVILSGSASDGSLGLIAVKEAGGITFAQDQASAEYNSMPSSAVSTGCVDFICSPKEIAEKITAISRHPYSADRENESSELSAPDDEYFLKIIKILRQSSSINFSSYKTPTIRRRVVRRMVLNRSASLKDYVGLLEDNSEEVKALCEDVLIHVTQFFRDPEVFEYLKNEVFSRMIEKKEVGTPIRIWVAGCATGEEAYSIAISLFEFLGGRINDFPILIFATDVKASCIETARKGIYVKGPAFNVTEEQLRRFFIKVGDGYQIIKSIRDSCVFSKHNVLSDPPYSKMDLVSCRNFLIYLNALTQKKLLPSFHYALKPSGFLLLGQSESIADHTDLFHIMDRKIKIYSKVITSFKNQLPFTPIAPSSEKFQARKQPANETKSVRDIFKEADRAILMKYEQAGVVVNENMEILQFRGDTSPFLNNLPGAPSTQLFKMVREGLGAELHAAISKVKMSGEPFAKKGLRVSDQNKLCEVSFEVLPLKSVSAPLFFLILFSSDKFNSAFDQESKLDGPVKGNSGLSEQEVKFRALEAELAATKVYLRSIIEEREASNLELQSANEEVQSTSEEFQSMNEELQSTNEELETAKEELQATNEEIITVNDELQNRVAQLTILNDDLGNLLASIHLPVIMVGKDLRIRRLTRMAGKVFNLSPKDIGRPITELQVSKDFPDLEGAILDVMATASVKEQEVQDELGKWYFMQIRAYKTGENKIDGAIVLMTNIDELKKNNELLEIQQVKLEISNQELEQFAYVASHDLQEPLRMISMYLELLGKRYQDKLDKEAFEFIGFAKNGAERSEKMIRDLLEYARIGTKGKSPKVTDIEAILKRTLSNLELDVLESGAEITHDPLPELMADRFQMVQLFQNLISNAIKYADAKPLKVHISAKKQDKEWLFSIKDNGIGIAPQYKDKIFALFQRLRTKTEHPGTGIGLAICKKIVERHGGKIWLESKQGQGSTFFFTLSEKSLPHAGVATA